MKNQLIEQMENEMHLIKNAIQNNLSSIYGKADVIRIFENYTDKMSYWINEVKEPEVKEHVDCVPMSVIKKVLNHFDYAEYCEADNSSAEFELYGNEIQVERIDVEFRENSFIDCFLDEIVTELEILNENDLSPQHN